MSASSAMQTLGEAIVAVVNADAAVQARTGRTTENIVRWRRRKLMPAAPVIGYLCVEANDTIGIQENWHVDVVLRALAKTPAIANGLLTDAIKALTPQALAAAGADAVVLEHDATSFADDDSDSTNAQLVEAEASLTVWITIPLS